MERFISELEEGDVISLFPQKPDCGQLIYMNKLKDCFATPLQQSNLHCYSSVIAETKASTSIELPKDRRTYDKSQATSFRLVTRRFGTAKLD